MSAGASLRQIPQNHVAQVSLGSTPRKSLDAVTVSEKGTGLTRGMRNGRVSPSTGKPRELTLSDLHHVFRVCANCVFSMTCEKQFMQYDEKHLYCSES
jgi:hypothetical protein